MKYFLKTKTIVVCIIFCNLLATAACTAKVKSVVGGNPEVVPSDTLHRKVKKKTRVVALDYFFNCEWKKNPSGDSSRYHYTWEDEKDSGFSMWGGLFRAQGASTVSIPAAPNAANLKSVDVYIVVDPDTRKESAHPNFIDSGSIAVLRKWVGAGGTLVLMANDSGNCEFNNFNHLANAFGFHFMENSKNRVRNNQYEVGAVAIPAQHKIFKTIKKIFVKEYASLAIHPPSQAVLVNGSDIVMADVQFGKGKVFAIGDPWLYNEYVNGKRITQDYENYQAANELAHWLLNGTKK